jgi:hypothetical protein
MARRRARSFLLNSRVERRREIEVKAINLRGIVIVSGWNIIWLRGSTTPRPDISYQLPDLESLNESWLANSTPVRSTRVLNDKQYITPPGACQVADLGILNNTFY